MFYSFKTNYFFLLSNQKFEQLIDKPLSGMNNMQDANTPSKNLTVNYFGFIKILPTLAVAYRERQRD